MANFTYLAIEPRRRIQFFSLVLNQIQRKTKFELINANGDIYIYIIEKIEWEKEL